MIVEQLDTLLREIHGGRFKSDPAQGVATLSVVVLQLLMEVDRLRKLVDEKADQPA